MDPKTDARTNAVVDAVVDDVREKRLSIDRRIDMIHERLRRFNPRRYPWQAWSERAWPFVATLMAAWLWRRYRYHRRFMRLP
jgi:hypothetical protein